jgi:hypothetical protein
LKEENSTMPANTRRKPAPDPLDSLAAPAMILAAIDKLPPKQKAGFLRVLYPELNASRIAELCGVAASTLSRSAAFRQGRGRISRPVVNRRVSLNNIRPHTPRQANALSMIEAGLRTSPPLLLALFLRSLRPEMKAGEVAQACGISPSELSRCVEYRRLVASERRPTMPRGWMDKDGNIEAYEVPRPD